MKKLNLDALAVESFGTAAVGQEEMGSGYYCTWDCVSVSQCPGGCWTYPTLGDADCTAIQCVEQTN